MLSISALQRARNELIQKGYLLYKPGGGSAAAKYSLIGLCVGFEQQSEQKTEQQSEQKSDNNTNNSSYIYKLNKTKIEEEKENACVDVAKFIEREFGIMISPTVFEKICSAVKEFDAGIVKLAVEESVLQEKRTWSYTSAILNGWRSKGVKTVEQAQKAISDFRERKLNQTAAVGANDALGGWNPL